MPTPSKFTAPVQKSILDDLAVGASHNLAADNAGIGRETLSRWLRKGREEAEGGRFRVFHDKVRQAEAHPRLRALHTIYDDVAVNPATAWKFAERMVEGYAPPMPSAPAPLPGPVVINLSLSDTPLPALAAMNIVDGEIVEESDSA